MQTQEELKNEKNENTLTLKKEIPASLKVFQDRERMMQGNNELKESEDQDHVDLPFKKEKKEINQDQSIKQPVEKNSEISPDQEKVIPKKDIEEHPDYKLAKDRLYETNRYARTLNQDFLRKNNDVIAAVNSLIENGDLSEDHAKNIISILKEEKVKKPQGFNTFEKEYSKEEEQKTHPFQKFFDRADNTVIQSYVDYTGDKQYQDKKRAFEQFVQVEATEEELNEIYETLDSCANNDARLVTKIMEIGEKFLKEGFGDFINAGSFRKYIEIKNNEVKSKLKEIDKLNRQLLQLKGHEDDKSTHGFEGYSSNYSFDDQGNEDKKQISPALKVFQDRENQFKNQQVGRR